MKDTYLSAKYYSLVGRRGKKRALIAVGHKILIMAYYILKTGTPYKELGNDYLNRRKKRQDCEKPCKAFAGSRLCGRIEESSCLIIGKRKE